jgi:hypothetical protein
MGAVPGIDYRRFGYAHASRAEQMKCRSDNAALKNLFAPAASRPA